MPIARAGGEIAIRMDEIDFANLAGGAVTVSATLIRIVIAGSTIEFVGNFAIDATGAVAGGTLTGMREYFNGILVYEVTGASVPASTFYNWVVNGQTSSALSAVFAGNDTFIGTRFDDYLIGYGGDDVIDGGAGGDIMEGGEGNDTYYVDNFNDQVFDSSGFDTIIFSFNFAVRSTGAIERYVMGAGVTIGEGSGFSETIEGNDLNNFLLGLAGNDILRGFAGNDFLRGGSGNDVIDGGLGFDTASYSDSTVGVTVDLSISAVQNTGFGSDQLISIEQLNGSELNDRLSGSSLGDTILGLGGNDIINGRAGNDLLTGGSGNDSLDGGAGFDIAFYSGTARQYVASVTTIAGNGEGTDTLVSIEGARFTDGTLSFDVDGQAAQIMRLYDAALDRQPDQAGFEGLLDELEAGRATTLSLAEAFILSPEFQARYGALNNQQFIEQLYRFCLNREGDAAGVQGWVNNMNSGTTRAEALVFFSESAEHRTLTSGLLNQGLWVADDQATIIARLYDATYDRLPDAGGLAAWTNNLKAGMPLIEIAAAFASAQEFQDRYGALTDRQFVEQMYRFCLYREGDATGIQGWVTNMANGTTRAEVLMFFSESAEHVALTRPLWLGGIQTLDSIRGPVLDDAADKTGEAAQVLIGLGDEADALLDGKADTAADQPQINLGPDLASDLIWVDLGLSDAGLSDAKWAEDAFVLPLVEESKFDGFGLDDLGLQVLPGLLEGETQLQVEFEFTLPDRIDTDGQPWVRTDDWLS